MRVRKQAITAIWLASLLGACMPAQTPTPQNPLGRLVYGTDGTNLVAFGSQNPATSVTAKAVTGLQSGERLVGLDFRPKDKKLYAVGDTSRIYALDPSSGAATPVAMGTFMPGLEVWGWVEALGNPASSVVTLMSRQGMPVGRAILRSDRRALLVFAMPAPPGGKVYQAWAIGSGQPIPVRTFRSPVVLLEMPLGSTALAVSQEPLGGSRTPTDIVGLPTN